jgi:hypothetical protein
MKGIKKVSPVQSRFDPEQWTEALFQAGRGVEDMAMYSGSLEGHLVLAKTRK